MRVRDGEHPGRSQRGVDGVSPGVGSSLTRERGVPKRSSINDRNGLRGQIAAPPDPMFHRGQERRAGHLVEQTCYSCCGQLGGEGLGGLGGPDG